MWFAYAHALQVSECLLGSCGGAAKLTQILEILILRFFVISRSSFGKIEQ
jgi:hypothetical protein